MMKIALAALAVACATAGAARADLPSYTFTGFAKGVYVAGLFGTVGASYDAPITITAAEKGTLDDPNVAEGVFMYVTFQGQDLFEVEDYGYVDLTADPIVSVPYVNDSPPPLSLLIRDLTSVDAGYWTTRFQQVDYEDGGAYDTFQLYRTSSAPEPSTWALMLAGVGLAGAALRARRRSVAVA